MNIDEIWTVLKENVEVRELLTFHKDIDKALATLTQQFERIYNSFDVLNESTKKDRQITLWKIKNLDVVKK